MDTANMTPSQFAKYRAKEIERVNKNNLVNEVGRTIQKYFGTENPYVATAMLGNIEVETGGSFDFKQKQYKGGPGIGLFQFDFHKKNYRDYLKDKKLKDSIDSQVRYVHDNIYGDQQKFLGEGNAKKLRAVFKTDDPIAISDMFEKKFLRPNPEKAHSDRRREASRMYSLAFIPAK